MSKQPTKANRPASVTESDDDGAFLSRWARRKRAARSGVASDTAEPESPVSDEMPAGKTPAAGGAPIEADPAGHLLVAAEVCV